MNSTLPLSLLALAALVTLGTGIWLAVLAFQKRIWWGLLVLFVPLASLVYTFVDWPRTKRPFLISLAALPLFGLAIFFLPGRTLAWNTIAHLGKTEEVALPTNPVVAPAGYALTLTSNNAAAEIDNRLAALRKKETGLLARKKALSPRDKAGALALSHEIVAYNEELKDALATRQRLVDAGIILLPATTPAAGEIAGLPFAVEKATLKDGVLTLRQGAEFFADREISIFLFLKNGESPVGRVWDIGGTKDAGNPHVHLSWRDAGQALPKTRILMNDYRLRLELVSGKNGAIDGRIAFTTNGDAASKLSGTFTALTATP